MNRSVRYPLRALLEQAGIAAALTTGLLAFQAPSYAEDSGKDACGAYDAAALDPRPIPEEVGGPGLLEEANKSGFRTPATMLGSPTELEGSWYNTIKLTPEDVKDICEKHLTAAFVDWSGVPYNLAIESGAEAVFKALGVKLLSITNYGLNSNGFQGALNATLPLHPDLIVTGGTVNRAQFAAILKPALDQGIKVVSWDVGSPTLKIGQNEPIKSLISYDFYGLGLQLADAVHKQYPNGAELGYIHWINDADVVHSREHGFLDGLKKYPNIHIVTNGEPDPGNPASGYTNPNSSAAFTTAFLTAHPNINLLFAPWEDPPAIGEAAAIKTLGLQDKVKIVTMDFGSDGAYQLKHNGVIVLDMAQDVYDAGRAMALTAALSAIGKDNHPYVFVPTYPVTPTSNIGVAWDFMHGPEVKCPPAACQ
jgi:ribose transport system substrate-binding protein